MLEHARLQWEEGDRRQRALAMPERRSVDRVVEQLVAELRRRLGSTFDSGELAALYDGSSAWTMALAVRVAPSEPLAWEQWVADAAFNRYLRDASDWPLRW